MRVHTESARMIMELQAELEKMKADQKDDANGQS